MINKRKKLLTYDELLEKFPNIYFEDAFSVFEEKTPEMTQKARLSKKITTGYLLKFLQDNNLTRKIICATAPDIPDDLVIYYRDLVPKALELDRLALEKWYARFDRSVNADPSDVRILEKYLKQINDQEKD